MSENDQTDDEQARREEVERLLAQTEDNLLIALYEKQKNEELDKLKAKQDKPPELSKLRRSKMTREQKKQVLQDFGVTVYEQLPH